MQKRAKVGGSRKRLVHNQIKWTGRSSAPVVNLVNGDRLFVAAPRMEELDLKWQRFLAPECLSPIELERLILDIAQLKESLRQMISRGLERLCRKRLRLGPHLLEIERHPDAAKSEQQQNRVNGTASHARISEALQGMCQRRFFEHHGFRRKASVRFNSTAAPTLASWLAKKTEGKHRRWLFAAFVSRFPFTYLFSFPDLRACLPFCN
jgi:hypothetical protein